ncbi:hypothetical protein HDV05_007097 [Chytridiales sp. JEL 0842]|nr:hypothetical protein HDV05_007097 [Chytridiales sp. JEL 0842]
MSDSIKVVIRVRPLNARELASKHESEWMVASNGRTIYQKSISSNSYTFDDVFEPKRATSDIYQSVAKDIIHSCINGVNGTIFAYGQTSSGKTYTMKGTRQEPGIIPLSIQEIFSLISRVRCKLFSIPSSLLTLSWMCSIMQTPECEFLLRVSYMEIYNEVIKDLLSDAPASLKIHEDHARGVFVGGLTEVIVLSPADVDRLIAQGENNRHVGETNMNERSSRSHTILRMVVESRVRGKAKTTDAVKVSCLNLVDLAGSERAGQTGAEGIRLKEGGHINKSLLALGTVIGRLSEGGDRGHIPYRDSKITRILQPSLGGNARTAIICTITPSVGFLDETISTLKFASRAKTIRNRPEVNEVVSDEALLRRYKKEISSLRTQLEELRRKEKQEDVSMNQDIFESEKLLQHMSELKEQILKGGSEKKAKTARRQTWFLGSKEGRESLDGKGDAEITKQAKDTTSIPCSPFSYRKAEAEKIPENKVDLAAQLEAKNMEIRKTLKSLKLEAVPLLSSVNLVRKFMKAGVAYAKRVESMAVHSAENEARVAEERERQNHVLAELEATIASSTERIQSLEHDLKEVANVVQLEREEKLSLELGHYKEELLETQNLIDRIKEPLFELFSILKRTGSVQFIGQELEQIAKGSFDAESFEQKLAELVDTSDAALKEQVQLASQLKAESERLSGLLSSEREKFDAEKIELMEGRLAMQNSISHLTEENALLRDDCSKSSSVIEELKAHISHMKGESLVKEDHIASEYTAKLNSLRAENDSVIKEKESLESTMSDLVAEVQRYRDQALQDSQKLQEFEENVAQLKEELANKEDEVMAIAKSECEKLVNQNDSYTKWMTKLEHENEAYRTRAENDRHHIEELKTRIASLEEEKLNQPALGTKESNETQDFAAQIFEKEILQSKIHSLERTVTNLQQENKSLEIKNEEDGRSLDQLRDEIKLNQEQVRITERKCQKLGEQLDRTEKELLSSSERISSLDQANRALSREVVDLRKELRENRDKTNNAEVIEENDSLRIHVDELQTANEQLLSEKRQIEAEKVEIMKNRDMIATELLRTTEALEELERCRFELLEKEHRVEELENEMEELKWILEQTSAGNQVPNPADPVDDAQEEATGKTLLGEVEDRRLDAEEKRGKITQKNAYLLKANSMLLQQHNQMRNQINYLSQQQTSQKSGVSEMVQQTIHQLRDELQQSLSDLAKPRSDLIQTDSDLGEIARAPQSKESKELIELLRLQLFELASENDSLKREMSTTRLLRLTDLEKVQNLEASLRQREMELQAVQADMVKLASKQRNSEFEGIEADEEILDAVDTVGFLQESTGAASQAVVEDPKSTNDENVAPTVVAAKAPAQDSTKRAEPAENPQTKPSNTLQQQQPREKRKHLDDKTTALNAPKRKVAPRKPVNVVVDRSAVNEADPGDCKTQ